MPSVVVLNQNNLVSNGLNDTFVYNFPNSVSFPHHEVAVQSVSIYYSWTNINSKLNNQNFKIYYPSNSAGAVSTGTNQVSTFSITLPEGQYEVADINSYIQFTCINAGFYMIDTNGGSTKNVYFIEALINPSRYAVQINTFGVPSSYYFTYSNGIWTGNAGTPYAGWTTPTNWTGFSSNIQGIFANTAMFLPPAFSSLFGYADNTTTFGNTTTYPSGQAPFTATPTLAQLQTSGTTATTYSYLSSTAPQLQPNSSVFLSLSNISNKYSVPNSIIYAINAAVAFGRQINIVPPQFAWNKLLNGTYNQLRLQILGLDYQPLTILDPNMTIVLVIRDTHEGLDDLQNKISGGK